MANFKEIEISAAHLTSTAQQLNDLVRDLQEAGKEPAGFPISGDAAHRDTDYALHG